MKSFKFRCRVDDLDYHGELSKPQYFIVNANSQNEAWDLALIEARKRCTEYGRVFEFCLDLI